MSMKVARAAWLIPLFASGLLVHCVADEPAVSSSGDGGGSDAGDGSVGPEGEADTGSLADAGSDTAPVDAASCIVRAADAGPPGTEDPNFAGGVKAGVSVLSAGMAVDQQGRTYVTGYALGGCSPVGAGADLILARFTAAGEVDHSFNTTGSVCLDFNGHHNADQGLAVGIDANNQPVVVGILDNDGFLGDETAGIVRFTQSGTLDTTFNLTGKLQLKGPNDGGVLQSRIAYAVAFDGSKIVVAGSNAIGGGGIGFVWEVNHDGTPASAFGIQGVVTDATVNGFYSVAVGAGGIFVGGAKNNKFLMRKYTTAGVLDPGFNGGEIVTSVSSFNDQVRGIAVPADGRPVAAGASSLPDAATFGNMTVLRGSNSDAGLDPSFGTGGYYKFPALRLGTDLEFSSAIAIQCDGKIVVAGTMLAATQDMSVVRLLPNGQLDTTFGNNGLVELSIAGQDVSVGVGIDPVSQGIVVLGRDISANPILYRFFP